MSYTGILHAQPAQEPPHYIKQQQRPQHQQNQHQQQPIIGTPEVIEMRPTAGFVLLPQEPPMQPSRVNHQVETTMSNGMAMRPAPDFNNPPSYALEDNRRRSQLPYSHHNHNYEELPFPAHPTESSTDDVVLEDKEGFQRQGSHTEVDQYFNPPRLVQSISSTPPPEKKPRKKVNPIYDRYEGPKEKITMAKEGYQQKSHSSSSKGRSLPVRCLRHPITTVFIFVLVAVVIVAMVLIVLGKIETPASKDSSSDTLVQPKVTTPAATTSTLDVSPTNDLMGLIQQQQRLIENLQARIGTLENMLGGSDANASLSTKVAMNTIKIDDINSRVNSVDGTVSTLQSTLGNTLSSLEDTKGRATLLENETRHLDLEMKSLTAVVVGQGSRISVVEDKNDAQDSEIMVVQQDISIVQQQFDRELSQVNRTIYSELDTISKMPGPRGFNGTDGAMGLQGPPGQPGAGNLSLCDAATFSASSATSVAKTYSRRIDTPPDKIITGVACSTEIGTLANLEVTDSATGKSYRCSCSGSDGSSSSQRICYIHYWQCPKTS